MSLAMAFGISELDVQIVMMQLLHMSEAEASEERADELVAVIDAESVADWALAGDSLDEQTQYAHLDIAAQLLEHLAGNALATVLQRQWSRVDAGGDSLDAVVESVRPDLDKSALMKAVRACEPGQFTPTLLASIEAQLVKMGTITAV